MPRLRENAGAKRGAELIKHPRIASPLGRRLQLICIVVMSSNRQSFHRVVAIDGPAASGKSSVARELAQRLGFAYVNSGAIYRAITWHILRKGMDPGDSDRVAQTAESAKITCRLRDKESHVLIDNIDPTDCLREDRVNESVSRVSSVPRVRRIAVRRMRDYARSH